MSLRPAELVPDDDPLDVQLPTHKVTGPALYPVCELGHPLAILDGSHVLGEDLLKHANPAIGRTVKPGAVAEQP